MRCLQFFYNLFFPVVFLLLLPVYLPRMFRRGGYRQQFLQRFGIFDDLTALRIGRGRFWIHAVSVGETFVALKFIHQLRKHDSQARFILSVTTATALEIAKKEASDWLEPILNPIDLFLLVNHFLKKFQPRALIMVEGDLWVHRVLQCKKLRIPTAIISARLSLRSEARFKKFSWIIAPLFNGIDFIGIPTKKDFDRWTALGVDPKRLHITGNIKFDQQQDSVVEPPVEVAQIFSSLAWQATDPIFLAGSTYGIEEEEIVMSAWLTLRHTFSNLRLIIAPRHVERREELLTLCEKLHLKATLRSQCPVESGSSDLLVLDTTGELRSWYVLATVVFIGKSLGLGAAHGGQNLVEPLALGRPVLVGPSMENFEPITSELLAAEGIIRVNSAKTIIAAAEELLFSPEKSKRLVTNGTICLNIHQGAAERTCELLLRQCRF